MPTPRINDIAAFMKARHDIYLDRKAGKPGPWTADPVLSAGRFCNIFRELDTVTIWIDQNIRQPYADHPHLWFMLAIARYINWPDTLRYLMDEAEPGTWPDGEDFEPAKLTKALEDYAAAGNKVYTGAYMIRAESDPSKEWYSWTKHRYIAEIVLGRLWEDRAYFEETLKLAQEGVPGWDELQAHWWSLVGNSRYIGWGPFMAYEVVTDLRHTRYLRNATDIWTWANAGPGAIRGLNRLYGRDLAAKPRPEQTNAEMLQLMTELNVYDEPGFNATFGEPRDVNPRFEMRDIEHSLCEFDKIERVRLGEGKMRSKYDWRKATPL